MSSSIKCFDIASELIGEANDRFAPIWEPETERLEYFKNCCALVDSLIDSIEADSFDIEIDEISMSITIKVECDEMIIEDSNHPYTKLVDKSIVFGFGVTKEGLLEIKFVFPGIWIKA